MDAEHAEVDTGTSALGRWDTVLRRPHPHLRPFVRSYQGYVQRAPAPMSSRHVPTGSVALIFGFGAGFTVTGPANLEDYEEQRTTFVAGLHDTYSDSQWLGISHGIQVDFTPIGAHMFFGVPMHSLANRVIELDDVLGAEGHRIGEKLRGIRAWDNRFRILESFIASRLVRAHGPSPEVAWAFGEIEYSRGGLSVGGLAGQLGWSQKRLIARFREQIGLPPKTVARIVRFNRAVRAAGPDPAPDWAQIAIDCGYYDQPHLIRDFREFAGATPGEFVTFLRSEGQLAAS